MSLRQNLLREAQARWTAGKGPWSKDPGELDQVDLVYLEDLADSLVFYSDERGLLSGCIQTLVDEVRNARGWPKPA